MKMNETRNACTNAPFIRSVAEAVARVEPADLSRFEGEGGPEVPEPVTPHPKHQKLFDGPDETKNHTGSVGARKRSSTMRHRALLFVLAFLEHNPAARGGSGLFGNLQPGKTRRLPRLIQC